MCTECLLILFLEAFINVLGGALILAIFIRVIQSWVPNARLPFGIGEFAYEVSEPLLGTFRRLLPSMGGFDLSPLVAIVAINVVQAVLLRLLPPTIRF